MLTRLFPLLLVVSFILFAKPLQVLADLPTTSVDAPAAQPTQAQIDAAASEAQAQGRVILLTPGSMNIPTALQEVASLPVTFRSTINNWNYDITVLSMSFTPTGSVLSIGCRFYLPGSANSTPLYFGANDIAVSGKSGFNGDLPILASLLSDAKSGELDDPMGKLGGETRFVEFPLPAFQNKAWMGLSKDSKLSFSCGEFKKFSLSGFLKVYEGVEREDPAGQSLTDGKPLMFFWGSDDVFDWQDMYFPATASRGFHSANAPDIGFHATDKTKILLDLSTHQSPTNLPDCGGGNLENDWQGIYFDAFSIRLPKLFKLRTPRTLIGQGTNLFLSSTGLIGTVTARNVFALEEGYTDEVNKFDLSLDQVTASFSCAASATISMVGRFRLGTCELPGGQAKELFYNVVYTGTDQRYQVLLKEKPDDPYKNTGLTLSTGSTLSLSVSDAGFIFQAALPAKPQLTTSASSLCQHTTTTLTVRNCASAHIKWSTGDIDQTTITIKPTITTTYSVSCADAYCIGEGADALTITVLDTLLQPTLTASLLRFCTYQQSTLNVNNCAGTVEWLIPGSNKFQELETNQLVASFPGLISTTTYTYKVRCRLQECYSPESSVQLTVYPEPTAPVLASNAPGNSIDFNGSVTLTGSCAERNTLIWENLPQPTVTLIAPSTYYAICKNGTTGCQTQTHSSLTISIIRQNCPPPSAPSLTLNDVSLPAGASTATLTLSGCPEGASLSWNTGDTGASLTRGVGTYEVSCTVSNPCGSVTTKASAKINPGDCPPPSAPSLTLNDVSLPAGASTATLTLSGCPEGASLSWNTGDTGASLTRGVGTYEVSCTVSNPCGSVTTKASAKINPGDCPPPNISVNNLTLVSGGSGKLTVSGCSNGTVIWNDDSQGNDLPVNAAGTYTATCTIKTDCGDKTSTGTVTVESETLTYTGKWLLCDGEGSTPKSFEGCSTGTIEIGLISGEPYSNSALDVDKNYYAVCKVNGQIVGRTTFSVSSGTRPSNVNISKDPNRSSIASGERITLSASANEANSYHWSTGETQSSITVSPTTETTYSVQAYSGYSQDGCVSTEVRQIISVNQTPCDPPSAPDIRVDNVVIGANDSYGTLIIRGCDGGIASWSTGEADVTSLDVVPGTYTVTCTVSNICGSTQATVSATVSKSVVEPCANPPTIPSISAAKTGLCGDESVVLTANDCNGTTTWSTDESASSITVSEANTYILYCSTDQNCTTTSASQSITKSTSLPQLSITQDGDILTVDATDCTSGVTWYNPNGVGITTGFSIDQSGYMEGVYVVKCTNACGEGSTSVSIYR